MAKPMFPRGVLAKVHRRIVAPRFGLSTSREVLKKTCVPSPVTGARKHQDPAMAHRNQTDAKPFAGGDAEHLLRVDTKDMTPDAAAKETVAWVNC